MELFFLPQVFLGAPTTQDQFSPIGLALSLCSYHELTFFPNEDWDIPVLEPWTSACFHLHSLHSELIFSRCPDSTNILRMSIVVSPGPIAPHLQTHIHCLLLRAGLIQGFPFSRTRIILYKVSNCLGPGPRGAMAISPKTTACLLFSVVLKVSSVPLCNTAWLYLLTDFIPLYDFFFCWLFFSENSL